MRALLIALVLVALGAGGYYFYQQREAPSVNNAAGAAQASPLPQIDGSAALDLFSSACVGPRQNFETNEARVTSLGWTEAPDDVDPRIARIMAISRGAMPGASDVVLRAYANPQRPEFIILTDLRVSGAPVNGCYVYDFSAVGLPEIASFTQQYGGPSESQTVPDVIDSRKWTRPLPQVANIRISHFPQGSPAEPELGFTGLVIAMTTMSY